MTKHAKSRYTAETFFTGLSQILLCIGIFLLLTLISHSVIAQTHEETTEEDNQVVIAVFEDHNEQVNSSDAYGLSWRLMEIAAASEGLDLIKIATDWQSAINRLKDGRLDMVFAAFQTEERSHWASFSLPLVSESSALFNSIESSILHLEDVDFEQEVVGVIANSTQEAQAQKLGFEHIYPARERKQLVKLLESGRIDYVLLGHSILKLYCPYKTDCLQQVGESLSTNFTRTMAMKNNQRANELLEKLNHGLAQIYNQRETQDLFQQFNYSLDYYQDWNTSFENEMSQ